MTVPFPAIAACTVVDELGMGVVIYMVDKSFSNGRNIRNHIQFNMVRQFQAAALGKYSVTAAAHSSRYSSNYHRGSVLHMYDGLMQPSLMDRFTKGMKKRIPEYSDLKKPLKSLVINYILNDIENKWVGSETIKRGRESC